MIGPVRRSVEKSASSFRKTKTEYVAYFFFQKKNIPFYKIAVEFDFD